MTKLLLKLFVPNYKDTQSVTVRDKAGKLSGAVCIVLNMLLSAAKIAVGALFSLVSVVADGINNLTDCGSNVVSLVSIKLAERPADKEHPYGHRRAEYVASMVVAFIVLVVAFELAAEGVTGIVNLIKGQAEQVPFNVWTVAVLGVSALVKLWMFVFNLRLSKRYNFELLKATAVDSISDVCATVAVLVAVVVSHFTNFNADGIMAVAVAVFIAVSGIKLLKETLRHLLGEGASEEMTEQVVSRIKRFEGVLGVHDLEIHNYGPNRYYASAHVEVDSKVPILQSHDVIDQIERDFAQNTDVRLVIHLDPIVTDDPELNAYKAEVKKIVKELDEQFDIHDFRMVKGPTHTNLIFDAVITFDTKLTEKQVAEHIQKQLDADYGNVYAVVTVERR